MSGEGRFGESASANGDEKPMAFTSEGGHDPVSPGMQSLTSSAGPVNKFTLRPIFFEAGEQAMFKGGSNFAFGLSRTGTQVLGVIDKLPTVESVASRRMSALRDHCQMSK